MKTKSSSCVLHTRCTSSIPKSRAGQFTSSITARNHLRSLSRNSSKRFSPQPALFLFRILRYHYAAAHRRVSESIRQPHILEGLRDGRYAPWLRILAVGKHSSDAQVPVPL